MSGGASIKIGENIKKLREFRGYSQEYMATELEISQKSYSNIESDEGKINKNQIEHIARILEIDPIQLLTFDDKLVFNSCNSYDHAQVVGMFNTYNIIPKTEQEFFEKRVEELKEQFEKRIEELKEEVAFLRSIIKDNK